MKFTLIVLQPVKMCVNIYLFIYLHHIYTNDKSKILSSVQTLVLYMYPTSSAHTLQEDDGLSKGNQELPHTFNSCDSQCLGAERSTHSKERSASGKEPTEP